MKRIIRIDTDGTRDYTLSVDYNEKNYDGYELEDIAKSWEEEDDDGTQYVVDDDDDYSLD